MQTFTEEEIAAEEERIGVKLPGELRRRYLQGVPETVVLMGTSDGVAGDFEVWGPSTTTSDKKGREYPTPGMAKETDEVRQTGDDFLSDEVLVAWGANAGGDLAVVLRDGSFGWWMLDGGEVEPVEVDWDPSQETLDKIEEGEPL